MVLGPELAAGERLGALDGLAAEGAPYRLLALEQRALLRLETGDDRGGARRSRGDPRRRRSRPEGLRGRAAAADRRRRRRPPVPAPPTADAGLGRLRRGADAGQGMTPDHAVRPCARSARRCSRSLGALALAGCQDREPRLPGDARRDPPRRRADRRGAARPLALPAPQVNADWSHRNGAANGRFAHLAFAANPQPIWTVDIGAGSGRRTRLISRADRRGRARLRPRRRGTAVGGHDRRRSSPGGAASRPPGQRADSGPGGGMAEAGGVLFVTTGFGEVMALNPATGGEYWRETLDAPIRAAPTVADGRVFVVARNDTAYAFSATDGAILWRVQGTGGPGVLGGASPGGRGAAGGVPVRLGRGARRARAQRAADLGHRGDRRPARAGAQPDQRHHRRPGDRRRRRSTPRTRAGARSRSTATTGERNWTIAEGAFGPAWPVGGSVFLLSDHGALVRVDAATGELIWLTQLPEYFNERRREAIAHHGPLLAGGRLWVASSDGLLRAFSPNRRRARSAPWRCPAARRRRRRIARGVMYVVTRDGRLHAFQ